MNILVTSPAFITAHRQSVPQRSRSGEGAQDRFLGGEHGREQPADRHFPRAGNGASLAD